MNDEQINQRIAEACGWTDIFLHPEFGLMGTPPNTPELRTAVEFYTVDLNAMHEAEKTLSIASMYVMEVQLKYVLSAREFYFHATARQRAEAFLRTLGKWDDQSGERTEMVKEGQK